MEHKAELDGIKASYTRMQAQLDETHRLLNDEHRRRFHLEDQLSHANMELQRVKDLEARLQQERWVGLGGLLSFYLRGGWDEGQGQGVAENEALGGTPAAGQVGGTRGRSAGEGCKGA